MDADTASPTVAISSDAVAPVTGAFSIAIAFSEPVSGFELADIAVGNGSPSALQGNGSSYSATITPAASGAVTVDIAAGSAEDDAGKPERRGRPVLDRRRPDPGAGEPFASAGGNPAEPDVGAGRHTERGRVRGVRRPRRRRAVLHGRVIGPAGGDGKCDGHLREARGGEGGRGHDPGDGDRPRRSEYDAATGREGGSAASCLDGPGCHEPGGAELSMPADGARLWIWSDLPFDDERIRRHAKRPFPTIRTMNWAPTRGGNDGTDRHLDHKPWCQVVLGAPDTAAFVLGSLRRSGANVWTHVGLPWAKPSGPGIGRSSTQREVSHADTPSCRADVHAQGHSTQARDRSRNRHSTDQAQG